MKAVVLVLMLACSGYAVGTEAVERSLEIEDFAAELQVHADGTLGVIETIRAHFAGFWQGLSRHIPLTEITPHGFRHKLRIEIRSVTDDREHPLPYETADHAGGIELKIAVPDAINATHTVVLSYQVRNVLRFFDFHDELYWNVTGNEWIVPIRQGDRDDLLAGRANDIGTTCFTGRRGSTGSAAETTHTNDGTVVRTTRVLSEGSGLTVAAEWERGVVVRPGLMVRFWHFLQDNPELFLPAVVLAVLVGMWHRWGRDPRRGPVKIQSEPPTGMTPYDVGLIERKSLFRGWLRPGSQRTARRSGERGFGERGAKEKLKF